MNYRYILSFLLVLFLATTSAVAAAATNTSPKKVRIAAFNVYPTIFQAKDGAVQGFYVDFLNEIATREGWSTEFVYGNWADGLDRIKSGEVDVLTNVAFTDDRAKFMDYGKTPLLTVWAELYVPTGSPIEGIRDVKDKKIALMKGDFNAANFKNLVEKFGISCSYVEFGNFEEVFKAISSRQVDGGVVNNTFGSAKQNEYDVKSSGVIFNPFDIFFTVAKGKNSDILATLDKYLKEWRRTEDSPYHRSRERWSHGTASTIRTVPSWLKNASLGAVLLLCVAAGFVFMLRVQVRRKTAEIQKYSDELHIVTLQLEEELAERQVAQETLQEQAILLEEEIAERSHVAEVLQQSEQRYRLLFENMTTGFALHEMLYDADGNPIDYRFLEINPAFESLTGLTAATLIGKTVTEVMPETEFYWIETYGAVAKSGQPRHYESYSKSLGKYFDCWAFRAHDGQFAVIISDISESKQLQDQLRHSQKMEAIGQLAGGVAHDFNNALQVIIGYSSILEMTATPEQKEKLHEIIAASERATELTSGLLSYSRKQVFKLEQTDINQQLTKVEKFIRRLLGEDVDLSIARSSEPLVANVDKSHFQQVFVNLATNARDAMLSGGRLSIHLERMQIDDEFIHTHGFGKAGSFAHISVSDTGDGIPPEHLDKIFEPFFTTKDEEKGTGLGLSIVYGIVTQLKGFITCISEQGVGTVFHIYLPLADEVLHSTVSQSVAQCVAVDKLTILLAEDDPAVRKITKKILELHGCTVLEAEHGGQAVEVFREKHPDIQLVILDALMPQMNGAESLVALQEIAPDVRFLFMSGYAQDIISGKMAIPDNVAFINKPVIPAQLTEAVRKIMAMGFA